MNMHLRSTWIPASVSVGERFAQIARLLDGPRLQTIAGQNWFQRAGSRTEALARAVTLKQIASGKSAWRTVRLTPGFQYRSLGVWNGQDDKDSAGLSVDLHDPASDPDRFVLSISDIDSLRGRDVEWKHILGLAELLSAEAEAELTFAMLGVPTHPMR